MASIFGGQEVKARCPKCRSRDFHTIEVFELAVISSVKNGVFPDSSEDQEPGGIIGISCDCDKCRHRWVPRGAKSLGDIINDRPLRD